MLFSFAPLIRHRRVPFRSVITAPPVAPLAAAIISTDEVEALREKEERVAHVLLKGGAARDPGPAALIKSSSKSGRLDGVIAIAAVANPKIHLATFPDHRANFGHSSPAYSIRPCA
jgi:hypothetical protein